MSQDHPAAGTDPVEAHPASGAHPTTHSVAVEGGALHLSLLGDHTAPASRTVLAVHGITASGAAWPAVAEALPDDWCLVAPDLRGRGQSREVTGEAGLLRHAADVCLVAEAVRDGHVLDAADEADPTKDDDRRLVLLGHSMGAYVAALAARARPDLFSRVVLVDGGVPLPLPEGTDPDEILQRTLGPALERLSQTYDSVDDYVAFFRQHPALGPFWDDTIEGYVRYDALETPDGVRSRAVEEVIRTDGRDLLTIGRELDDALRGSTLPTHLLVAPLGMFGQAPGLLPADAVRSYDEDLAHLTVETVPDVNHYTILFDRTAAARVAEVVTGDRPS